MQKVSIASAILVFIGLSACVNGPSPSEWDAKLGATTGQDGAACLASEAGFEPVYGRMRETLFTVDGGDIGFFLVVTDSQCPSWGNQGGWIGRSPCGRQELRYANSQSVGIASADTGSSVRLSASCKVKSIYQFDSEQDARTAVKQADA